MWRWIPLFFFVTCSVSVSAQGVPVRPDAFPPVEEAKPSKGLEMALTVEEMASWDRYPTYGVYVEWMRQTAARHADICRLDTIGFSVEGRAILALDLFTPLAQAADAPEFMYSGTIHGDELLPFYLLLRLADSLLENYGSSHEISDLLDNVRVVVNPLSNPDGTYHGGDSSVAGSWRYNSLGVDLNRNYPDPFGAETLDTLQEENRAMIDYVARHHFRLAANLHSGSEVLNYPWDSFTSRQRSHEDTDWWQAVCRRFVDSVWARNNALLRGVSRTGYIAGGDWYVIHNGRQDYMNYYHGIREMTLEVSNAKKLPTSQLDGYWNALAPAMIAYIGETLHLDEPLSITPATEEKKELVFPNPTRGMVSIRTPTGITTMDLSDYPAGVHLITVGDKRYKVVKL